ncbi:MAG: TolC family protein [Planctomycetota bacterium]
MIRLMILIFSILVVSGCTSNTAQKSMSAADDHPDRVFSASGGSENNLAGIKPDAVCEPNGLLTLKDALQLTLIHNPELQSYSYGIRVAQARQLQSGRWQNPKLGIEVENVGGSGNFSGFDASETTIQLSQLIPMGGKVQKRQKVYAYDTALFKLDYEAKQLDIGTELTKLFVNLLLIQRKKELSHELVQISSQVAGSIDKRVQAGKDSPLDLSKANVAVAKAKIQHHGITQYESVFRKKLASFWANQTPTFTALSGQLDQVNEIPEQASLQDLLQNNPDVARWAIEVQKRKAQVEMARSESTPDITLGGGVKYFNETDDTAIVFGLSVPLPVANQYRDSRLEASHNLRKTLKQQQVSFLDAWNELNRLYANLENAYVKATILKNEVLKTSSELFAASEVSYKQGKIDYLALMDAQKIYFESKNDYIDALAEYHTSKTELERLIGQNLQAINQNP